VDVLVACR